MAHALQFPRRSLFAATIAFGATVGVATAQQGDRAGETQGELPAAWQVRESPALTPGEALAAFSIVDGYRIELVAAEPLVEAPIAFEFGRDGRLWVVEMRGYMRDASGSGGPSRSDASRSCATPTATDAWTKRRCSSTAS